MLSYLHNFFFLPKPTEGIAVFRIVWCSLLLFYFPFGNILNLFPDSQQFAYGFMAIYGLALLSALVGFETRLSFTIVIMCLTIVHQINLQTSLTFFLLCSPCGHSLSVDGILCKDYPHLKKSKVWAPWALRLIQIQISAMYLITVWNNQQSHAWLVLTLGILIWVNPGIYRIQIFKLRKLWFKKVFYRFN